MKWQSALIALLALALASVDLSALASMTSEPAADLVLALAASQVGLAGLWCGLGGGSSFVRLAVAGLLVNVWSSALGRVRPRNGGRAAQPTGRRAGWRHWSGDWHVAP